MTLPNYGHGGINIRRPHRTDILRYYKLNLILRRHYGFIMTASWKIILSVLGGVTKRRSPIRNILTSNAVIINLLLTEREGRTKTTEGQYFPVRLEQTRLVSSLLYGTRSKLVYFKKRVSGHMNSKGFRCDVFLMTRANQPRYHEVNMKTNKLNVYM